MKRYWILWTVVALGVLAGAGVAGWRLFGPVTVEVAHPARGPAVRAVYATGTFKADLMSTELAQVGYRIVDATVEPYEPAS